MLYTTSLSPQTPFRGPSYTRTRGRNAHKKRANIQRKSESTKYFALIFKQLRIFPDARNAGTLHVAQHSTREKIAKQALTAQTTRDAHNAHHPTAEPRATATTTKVTLWYLARDFQLSTALFLTPCNQEVIIYIEDTFLSRTRQDTRTLCSYKVEIAWMLTHHVAPQGHRAIFYLIRPLNRGTRNGHLARDLPIREYAFANDEPYSYKQGHYI